MICRPYIYIAATILIFAFLASLGKATINKRVFTVPSLAYRVWGSGGVSVVYFAGLAGSSLENFAEDETSGRLVYTFDRPGLGLTPFDDEQSNTRYTEVAAAVKEIMSDMGHAAYNVAGWSSGGPFALSLAVVDPHAVKKVSLVASDPQWARSAWSTLLKVPHQAVLYLVFFCLRGALGDKIGRHILGHAIEGVFYVVFGLSRCLEIAGLKMHHTTSNFMESFKGNSPGLAVASEIFVERSLDWGFELPQAEVRMSRAIPMRWTFF